MNIMPAGALAFVAGYVAMKAADMPRAKRAVHVFRGRPMIYGLTYSNGAIRPADNLRIDSVHFEGYSSIPAIELTDGTSSLTRLERRMSRRLALADQRVRTARKALRPSLP